MQRALLCALASLGTALVSVPRVAAKLTPRGTAYRPGEISAIKDEIIESATYYADELCIEEDECAIPDENQFCIAVLGDLHMDPRKMVDYVDAHNQVVPILQDAQSRGVETAVVSLGDLGESKSVDPENTAELFAGTTACHELAAEYLSSFGTDYEVIGGNHDLEGIDEFKAEIGRAHV